MFIRFGAFEEHANLQLGVEFPLFSGNQGAKALRARPCFHPPWNVEKVANKQQRNEMEEMAQVFQPHRFHTGEMLFVCVS